MKKMKIVIFLIGVGLIFLVGFQLGNYNFNKLGNDPDIDFGDFDDDGVIHFQIIPIPLNLSLKIKKV